MEVLLLALLVMLPLLIGLCLVMVGRRGVQVNDHPFCRKCGFDLYGLSTAKVCPECGKDLAAKRAIGQGMRERRVVMARFGWTLTVVGLVVGGWGGAQIAPRVDWQKLKPNWWLVSDATSSPSSVSDAALAELRSRVRDRLLSSEQIERITDAGLDFQGDLKRTWRIEWGNLIQAIYASGMLADEDMTRYCQQACKDLVWIEIRPRVRRGDPVPYYLHKAAMRLGSGDDVSPRYRVDRATFANKTRKGGGYGTLGAGVSSISYHAMDLSPKEWDTLEPAKHELTVHVTISMDSDLKATGPQNVWRWKKDIALKKTLEVIDPSTHTIELVSDPSQVKAMESAIRGNQLKVEQAVGWRKKRGDDWYVSGRFQILPAPIDRAFEVYMSDGDREWRMSDLTMRANKDSNSYPLQVQQKLVDFNAKTVDLIFRPSRAVGYRTPSMTRIWNGEIVLKDVELVWKVERPGAAE